MNNEEKILAMLEKMGSDISALQHGQAKLEQGQTELKADINERFDRLEAELKYAWKDISIVEKRILQHEEEYHPA